LGAVTSFREKIRNWRAGVNRRRLAVEAPAADPARWLHKHLIKPLAPYFPAAGRLLIAPDGVLAQLPFGALPGADPAKFLIEEVEIVVAPGSILPELELPERAVRPGTLLAAGGIDYGKPRAGAEIVWGALPGTLSELERVQKLFTSAHPAGATTVLTEEAATKAAFIKHAPAAQNLLVATHGYFKAAEKLPQWDSNLALPGRLKRALTQSGVRCGLVFAAANSHSSPPETLITGYEIAGLDFSGAQLVVLSACETGRGESIDGEGVLGLQRAFAVAGARSVVASLWTVEDSATAKLISLFHTNLWQKKLPPGQALRMAQLTLMRSPASMIKENSKRVDFSKTTKLAADASKPAGARSASIAKPSSGKTQRATVKQWAPFVLSGAWK